MATSWCNSCVGGDPTQDTVKVNPNLLIVQNANKENLQPVKLASKGDEQQHERDATEQKLAEEHRKRAEAEAKPSQEQQNAIAAAEEKRLRQEAKKAAAAEEERLRQEAKNAEDEAYKAAALASIAAASLGAQQQRLRQEAHRVAEEQARRERKAAEEVAEHAAALDKVNAWCKSNGYHQGMNTQKKTFRGSTKFPLHTAVKQKNEEMVGLLLKCGVDKSATDSRQQTACQLAEKMKLDGILTMLH